MKHNHQREHQLSITLSSSDKENSTWTIYQFIKTGPAGFHGPTLATQYFKANNNDVNSNVQ